MSSTRLMAASAFLLMTIGLVLLASEGAVLVTILGAILVVGSGLFLIRHLWREAERKRKATLDEQREALAQQRSELESGLADLRERMAFSSTRDDIADLQARVELEVLTQLSGVVGVYSALRPSMPFPSFGRSAIAGDCAARLVRTVMSRRPATVVEAGSGLSTLLIAAAMEATGQDGIVVSLEHHAAFSEVTKRWLSEHGLEGRARVVHAPLIPVEIGGEVFRWYDLSVAELPESIDLVFVDGPPGNVGPSARYPALPLLYDKLSSGGVVLADDAHRPEERAVIDRWQSEWPNLDVRVHRDMKGTAELVKN